MNKLISRKFILTLLIVIFSAVAFLINKVSFNELSLLLAPVLGTYFISNALSKKDVNVQLVDGEKDID